MISVAEKLIAAGASVCAVEGRLLKGWKRGRPSNKDGCHDLKMKPNSSRWISKKVAAKTLDVTDDEIVSMVEAGKLRPAIHRGNLFISLASIKGIMKGKEPPLPPEIVLSKLNCGAAVPSQSSKVERLFVPTCLTRRETPSERWISSKSASKHSINHCPEPSVLAIKVTEYVPEEFGYEINDVAVALNKRVCVIQSLISGYKVEAKFVGDKQYITKESLVDFMRRSHKAEIQDI